MIVSPLSSRLSDAGLERAQQIADDAPRPCADVHCGGKARGEGDGASVCIDAGAVKRDRGDIDRSKLLVRNGVAADRADVPWHRALAGKRESFQLDRRD